MNRIPDSDVALRKFEPRDVDSLIAFRNDPVITSLLGGFSTGYSRADLADWIEFHRQRRDEVLYAIVDSSSDTCIGHVGLYQIDHISRKAEFAILIGFSDYQGRGLGEKVTRFMVDFGFSQLNLNKVALSVIASNSRAIALYKKLGFIEEGTLRQDLWRDNQFQDVLIMSILRDER